MANGLVYIGSNSIAAIGTLTGSISGIDPTDTTTATGYDAASMISGRQSNVWQSDTTTSTQYIYIDAGFAINVDIVTIHNHNFPSGGAAVVEYETDDTLSSGNWTSATEAATFTYRAGSMYVTFGNIQRRYWRIKVTGINSTLVVGEIVMGQATQMARAFKWGVVELIMPHVAVSTTQAGVPWFLTLVPDTRQFALSWASMTKAQQDELVALHGLLTKGTITVVPFTDEIESARSTEVYEVWTQEPLSITINRDVDRHGGLSLIETPKHLSVS